MKNKEKLLIFNTLQEFNIHLNKKIRENYL